MKGTISASETGRTDCGLRIADCGLESRMRRPVKEGFGGVDCVQSIRVRRSRACRIGSSGLLVAL